MTKDFLDEITKEQKILDIGLKQSKQNKEDRREKTLHELLMEGFREEQEQRRLEEETDIDREENTIYNTNNEKGK